MKIYIHAPIERVWEGLSNHEGLIRFSDVTYARLLQEGQGNRNGLGAVREVHFHGVKFVEDIVAFEPPRLLEYKVKKCSMPIEHDIGRVELIARGEGTEVHYLTRFRVKVPVIGGWLGRRAALQFRNAFWDLLLEAKDLLEGGK